MAAILHSTILPVRTDPLDAPKPQTMARWSDVLAFLHYVQRVVEAGTAFQLVETPGQVACVVADIPVIPAKAAASSRPRRAGAKKA